MAFRNGNHPEAQILNPTVVGVDGSNRERNAGRLLTGTFDRRGRPGVGLPPRARSAGPVYPGDRRNSK